MVNDVISEQYIENEIFTICRENEDIFLKNEDYRTYFFCFDKIYKI